MGSSCQLTLDRTMSGSPTATVPLDNDSLEPDEETSLRDRRFIKDPVHGFRVSPSSPLLSTMLMTDHWYDANSRIRLFCLQIHRHVYIFLLLPTVVRVAYLVALQAAVPASPAPQTTRDVLFRMARRITQ